MKTSLLIAGFLIASTVMSPAQNIDYESVRVEYTKLPLKPLDKTIRNYQVNISMGYLQKIELKKAEHQQNIQQNELNYQAQQKAYNDQLGAAALMYQQQMNAWNKLTPQQKAVTPKPEMPLIPAPVKATVAEPQYEKTFNTELLANQNLKLEGYNKLPDNAVSISISLMGFENEEAKLVPKTTTQKKDNVNVNVTTYSYQFNYRHQVKLRMTLPNGTNVIDEFYTPSLSFRTYSTKDFNTQAEADMYWVVNKNAEMVVAQDRAVNDMLKMINEHLNDEYGFRKSGRYFYVAWVNEKSNYNDYRDALTNAKNAYAIIGNPNSFNSASESLLKAIESWEKAMTESNPKNKKARVDEDVTECTLLNLIEAYAWLNNFDKAQQYHSQLMTFSLSNKEKGYAGAAQAFISDQRKRVDANK